VRYLAQINSLLKKWNIQCVIFDLDGTLVDTLDKHIQAFEILFSELNIDITYEAIAENMGRTPKDTLKSLMPEQTKDKEKLEQLASKKEIILSDLLKSNIALFDGALALVDLLKEMDLPLCLASSTPEFNVMKMLKAVELDQHFNVIITGEDITIGKPNPQVFLNAAKKANISPQYCLVIGDSPHDIQAANAAGMKIIAVNTGKHDLHKIEIKSVDKIVTSLVELL